MTINNERGVAMIFTLFLVVNILVLQTAFTSRSINGAWMTKLERSRSQSFYASQGGANAALQMIDTLINNYLQNTIVQADPSGVATTAKSRVQSGDGIGWLIYAVRDNNVAVLTQNGEEALFSATGNAGGMPYSYTITFSEKSDPYTVSTDVWEFPYVFRITSTGTMGSLSSQVVLNGDFTVRVQKDNFAKFSLFTNQQETPSGSRVWFTGNTSFFGPVHTNDRFNFAFNPSGKFTDTITQSQQTARFYNGGSSVLLDNNANGTTDVPSFSEDFTRGVAQTTLNSGTAESDMSNSAKGNNNYNNNGIYFPSSGGTLNAGIYVRGDATVAMSVDANDHAVYTITQGGSTRVVTVNESADQTSVLNPSTGSTTSYSGVPDGTSDAGTLIFVNGNITSLAGTVQKNTAVTIASHSDITITNHVRYEDYTPSSGTSGQSDYVPPTADGAENLLGLVSWTGDVVIGTAAPNNIDVHGTVMAQNGIFTVDNYDSGSPRGTATLLGGAITDDYGAFGQFNSSTGQMTSGYGRNFIYDARMQAGKAPPYFPSLKTFIAFTNDITDKIVWQEDK